MAAKYFGPSIISATGTKGKTTFTLVLADILHRLKQNVLHVTTTGHYVNGEQRSTAEDSKETWRLVPTLAPGRYLWEFLQNPELRDDGVAVLECSLGCGNYSGLGYRSHSVGVFLNVFEDHMGAETHGGKTISSRADIAIAKDFIFRRLRYEGAAVFNADDEYVCERLNVIKPSIHARLLPCGLEFTHFNVKKHLADGGVAFTVRDGKVVCLSGDDETVMCDLGVVPWAFGGQYLPSVWNLLHVSAAVYAHFNGKLPAHTREAIEATRLGEESGRLTLFKAANGATILADFAHEKVSLEAISKLAHGLVKGKGRVIGVVRLAHDRTDEQLRETGHIIAEGMDELVVYDKIDGYWRLPTATPDARWPQVVGLTAEKVTKAISEKNSKVTTILREDKAIEYAASIADKNDVVVVIVGNDVPRSVGFIKKSFDATAL